VENEDGECVENAIFSQSFDIPYQSEWDDTSSPEYMRFEADFSQSLADLYNFTDNFREVDIRSVTR